MSQQRISNPPLLSSARAGWDGILVEKYRLPASESHEVSPYYGISISLGRPFELEWRLEGGHLHRKQIRQGEVSITPSGMLTQGRWHQEIECLFLSINPILVERTASELTNTSHIEMAAYIGVRDPQIHYIGLALLAELEAGCLAGHLYGESLSLALAVHLFQRYSPARKTIRELASGLPGRQLQQAIDYINDNLAQDLTLSEIAESLGISPYYFSRLFKQSTGLPPHQYVIKCRIERAKILLAENKLPIVEIGYRVGCSSQSNFTTLFHKHMGITPKAYQEQTKSKGSIF